MAIFLCVYLSMLFSVIRSVLQQLCRFLENSDDFWIFGNIPLRLSTKRHHIFLFSIDVIFTVLDFLLLIKKIVDEFLISNF